MRALLLIVLALIPIMANADFEGTYKCKGVDPYLNKEYSGTVTIYHQNTVYGLKMEYDTGEKYIGTGGQYNPELLSVVFQDINNLKRVGLEQYALLADKKTIAGYWVYLGGDKLGTEVCKKVE